MIRPRNEYPVSAIGDARLHVSTDRGEGNVPLFVGRASGNITRIVIVLHGRLRDADAYLRTAERALAASSVDADSTVLIAPQFLATADIEHHALGSDMLHWEWTAWMGGLDARGPHALSAFDVLDALIADCAARYTMLREIVIAGHSGGAQVAHRYAIVGHPDENVRYVIANPSSYVYFDATRPYAIQCDDFDDWKYGLRKLPRYAKRGEYEARYIATDVTYLLGERDCDPAHPALDRSCAAMSQGPHRLARGRAYRAYLLGRHPDLRHRWEEVPNADHDGEAMFVSAEGVRALFGDEARFIETAAAHTGGASE
ncbi:hypothetical protein [Caballeronia sp. BR00000012568055]|uniref:hypothetical protein n=1 Tax=Caballeronia sp. BR00000012568055 TaxID=2918761 RepID=UPI0023FA28B1|nr:hypothetical protein [Caballeronia sp. BR00000012568055]